MTWRFPMKWACVIGLSVGLAACNGANARENTTATETAAATTGEATNAPISAATSAPVARAARFTEVTIPSGTTLRLALSSAVGSDTSRVEEPVRATLRTPVTVNGQVVLPAGSEVAGVVTDAEGSGRVKGRARIAMRFNSISDRRRELRHQDVGYAQQAAATKKQDATKIAVGAGAARRSGRFSAAAAVRRRARRLAARAAPVSCWPPRARKCTSGRALGLPLA